MFTGNYKKLAKNNTDFRKVLYTGPHAQVVAMYLQPGEDIGAETHANIDQIFIFVDGKARAMVDGETHEVEEKDIVYVPAGTIHNVTNSGNDALKLITFYAPAAHPDGTIQATKEVAIREATAASHIPASPYPA